MRDLSRLAKKIQMENMKMIAREQLEIDDTDIDNIAADCRDKTYEFNYEILKKWWKRSHEHNQSVSDLMTVEILFTTYTEDHPSIKQS